MKNEIIKEVPHSKESEMMVLGCMLTSLNGLNMASEKLDDADFYYTEHKIIFRVLKSACKQDKPADVHLICEELKRMDKLKSVGGVGYITALAQYAGTSAYIEEYIQSLKELSSRRNLIDIAEDFKKDAFNSEISIPNLILKAQENLNQIEKNQDLKDKFPLRFLNEFDENFLLVKPEPKPMLLDYSNVNGIPTGFLPKSIVGMLVGGGGSGKTHILAQLAISIASGTPWLDTFTTTKHCGEGKKGNVFLGLGENQYDDIHRLLHKASKKLREHQPDIVEEDPLLEASKRIAAFSFCGQQAAFLEDKKPSVYFRQFKMNLIEHAPKDGWTLIILDPASRLMGGDTEVDSATATSFIALLEELTIDLPGHPSILIAHHKTKEAIKKAQTQDPDQTAARGTSALTDGVRWQIDLTKNKDDLKLVMTKTNFTARMGEIILSKDNEGYIFNIPKNETNKTEEKENDSKPYKRNGSFLKGNK